MFYKENSSLHISTNTKARVYAKFPNE